MTTFADTVASVRPLRRMGSAVTSRLKRWAVDVAISGYPKCGNTWYGAMLRQLLVDRYGLSGVPLSRLFVSDLGVLPLPFLRLPDRIPRLYHNHFMPFPDRPDLAGIRESLAPFDDKPMIVLIRACKDVLVSYYAMEVERFHRSHAARDVEDFVLGATYGVRKYVGYYNLIAESRRGGAPTLVTSYEELWRDPAAVLARDGNFIGAGGLPREAIDRIVRHYSFDNMRRMELASSEEEAIVPGLHRVSGAGALFVRKGGSGNWREELTGPIAAEIDAHVAKDLDPLFRAAALGDSACAA